MAKYLLVLTLLAGTLYPLYAQIPGEDWSRIALLGANTLSIGVSPKYDQDKTVFAGTSGSGLWHSDDQGISWQQGTSAGNSSFLTSSIAAIAVSPDYATDNALFALTADGKIYGSTDKGATFTLLRTISGIGTSMAISPAFRSDRTLWAGFDGAGLWYSTNAGATWTQESQSITRYPNIHALEVSPAYSTNNTLYVGGHHTDYGPFQIWAWAKWQSASSGMGSTTPWTVNALTVRRVGTTDTVWLGTEANGMYYSLGPPSTCVAACDGGTQGTSVEVDALDFSNNATPMLLEGRVDGLFQSTSPTLGATCNATTPLGPIQAIRFEPLWDDVAHCHIFVGTPFGLYRKGCAVPLGSNGPDKIDGKCVALAHAGQGAFLGTSGNGLFKSQAQDLTAGGASRTMVQFNNFPNKQTPDVVAICLDPIYDDTSDTCASDKSTLFVAVNFRTSSTDNGVYKSGDWGNTWTKLATGWRTGTVTLYDLAISPSYAEGAQDQTLYAATDVGLFRWNGADGWADITRDSKNPTTFRVGVPPTFNRVGTGTWDKTMFIADAAGVYYNTSGGSPGYWYATGYTDAVCNSSSTVTGFAFAGNWGRSGGTTRMFVSNSSTSSLCGSIHTTAGSPFNAWYALNDGDLPPTGGANDIAATASFDEYGSNHILLCAAPTGTYIGNFDRSANKAGWARRVSKPTSAVAFDAGGQSAALNAVNLYGGYLSLNGGGSWAQLAGFNSLPDDVFQTLVHQRDPNTLFAASPSMGVFVSQNKGLSFRPWNDTGSCALRSAYGLGMEKDRIGTNWDVIWVGTGAGIKYHRMYYNNIDYPGYYWSNTTLTTGRYERFSYLAPANGGSAGRVWAASPVAGTGLYYTDGYSSWSSASSPGSSSKSVRIGYADAITPTMLTSGTALNAQSVTYSNWDHYAIVVPDGQASLTVTMTPTGSSGDPDLYVRMGAIPTQTLWDYRPYKSGLAVETVTVNFPVAGVWYIGVRGFASGASTFNLVATYSLTAAPELAEADAFSVPPEKPEQSPFESRPTPKGPSAGTIWGTINGGVILSENAGVDWQPRNGIAPNELSNPNTQTVLQLKDGTVVTGCLGDAFYSPQSDGGLTTWLPSTAQFPGSCSYDFRDLYEVDLNPGSATDYRTDTLIAAYGTGASTSGGVWLSGDKGHHWMKISSGFDPNSQQLNSLTSDVTYPVAPDAATAYYTSTDGTGVYTRTLTIPAYPTVTGLSSASGPSTGGGTITVTGTGFSNACPTGDPADCLTTTPVVLFGETEATTSWVDATHLSAIVPAHVSGVVEVSVRNPDTRRSVTNATYTYSCALSPSSLPAITAADKTPYLKSGVDITWAVDPGAWQDGGTTGRLYRVLRSGVDISGALPYGVGKYTDTTGTANVSYNYAVTYTNGCGLSATTGTAPAMDQFIVPPEAASTPDSALQWTSGLKTQLTWGATTGATGYRVYKGTQAELRNLGSGSKVCLAYQGAGMAVGGKLGTTTTLTNEPSSGSFFWYVITATNGAGEGPLAAGEVVSSTGACASP